MLLLAIIYQGENCLPGWSAVRAGKKPDLSASRADVIAVTYCAPGAEKASVDTSRRKWHLKDVLKGLSKSRSCRARIGGRGW